MPNDFLQTWHSATFTSLGLFWMALWVFGLGYLVSSMIQVFMTRERMRRSMGDAGARSVLLGSFFGFVSSSCSFAALATTRSLFAKGAGAAVVRWHDRLKRVSRDSAQDSPYPAPEDARVARRDVMIRAWPAQRISSCSSACSVRSTSLSTTHAPTICAANHRRGTS